MKKWYLVCYDVREEKRLRQVARKLEGYGERVQLSVFRCRTNDRGIERLRWELAGILAEEDSLLIVPLCGECVRRIRVRNGKAWPEAPAVVKIV